MLWVVEGRVVTITGLEWDVSVSDLPDWAGRDSAAGHPSVVVDMERFGRSQAGSIRRATSP